MMRLGEDAKEVGSRSMWDVSRQVEPDATMSIPLRAQGAVQDPGISSSDTKIMVAQQEEEEREMIRDMLAEANAARGGGTINILPATIPPNTFEGMLHMKMKQEETEKAVRESEKPSAEDMRLYMARLNARSQQSLNIRALQGDHIAELMMKYGVSTRGGLETALKEEVDARRDWTTRGKGVEDVAINKVELEQRLGADEIEAMASVAVERARPFDHSNCIEVKTDSTAERAAALKELITEQERLRLAMLRKRLRENTRRQLPEPKVDVTETHKGLTTHEISKVEQQQVAVAPREAQNPDAKPLQTAAGDVDAERMALARQQAGMQIKMGVQETKTGEGVLVSEQHKLGVRPTASSLSVGLTQRKLPSSHTMSSTLPPAPQAGRAPEEGLQTYSARDSVRQPGPEVNAEHGMRTVSDVSGTDVSRMQGGSLHSHIEKQADTGTAAYRRHVDITHLPGSTAKEHYEQAELSGHSGTALRTEVSGGIEAEPVVATSHSHISAVGPGVKHKVSSDSTDVRLDEKPEPGHKPGQFSDAPTHAAMQGRDGKQISAGPTPTAPSHAAVTDAVRHKLRGPDADPSVHLLSSAPDPSTLPSMQAQAAHVYQPRGAGTGAGDLVTHPAPSSTLGLGQGSARTTSMHVHVPHRKLDKDGEVGVRVEENIVGGEVAVRAEVGVPFCAQQVRDKDWGALALAPSHAGIGAGPSAETSDATLMSSAYHRHALRRDGAAGSLRVDDEAGAAYLPTHTHTPDMLPASVARQKKVVESVQVGGGPGQSYHSWASLRASQAKEYEDMMGWEEVEGE